MSHANKNIAHVPVSKKNEGIVDFIRNEIKAKKERHKAIFNSISDEFISKLKKSGKVHSSR